MSRRTRFALALVISSTLAFSACSMAVGEVSASSCEPSTRLMDGKFEFGYEAKLTVTNTGGNGDLTVRVAISSSEGEWERTQTLAFDAGEAMDLAYFFHEPTINVQNVQCRYRAQ